jgi:hypothetical protein
MNKTAGDARWASPSSFNAHLFWSSRGREGERERERESDGGVGTGFVSCALHLT